jgi:hypothetical protein
LIGQNQLGEQITASPAVADGALYIRSSGALYKIATK